MRGNGTQGAALGWVRVAFQAGMGRHTDPRPMKMIEIMCAPLRGNGTQGVALSWVRVAFQARRGGRS